MTNGRITGLTGLMAALLLVLGSNPGGQSPAAPRFYNSVKQKLSEGKPVVGGTVSVPDPQIYCAVAKR